ncbi:TetR/AcrR family transcriptional regulator [Erwinia endophytica]|uniref:TetR/AcrR family transcriptional regulator n=1 Tax=Erwinia endophytica TaxID=1563158 RepID=UPI001265DF7C|nr:TetR/AcrR family transcriptional regulator [Erwinia endophytica]KAB8307567.1 TetR/AcrR family transcriptional regulator [Erwinia endophytica]
MKRGPGRPREFEPDEFLNAAMHCFWQKGYRATSLADLMQQTGLASASIYKLYPDKKAIFLAALKHYMDQGFARRSRRAAELAPENALRETLEFGVTLSTGAAGEKGCFSIAAASEMLPGDAEVMALVEYKFRDIIGWLSSVLSHGQKSGVFRQDRDAEVMAECLFMMLEGMRVYGKIQPDREMLNKAVEFIISTVLVSNSDELHE